MKRVSLWTGILIVFVITVLAVSACSRLKSPAAPTSAPVISLFAADATSLTVGQATMLRWDVLGDGQASVRIDPAPGNVPTTGSAQITPVATTTYTLVARNDAGSSQRILTITVK